MESLKLMKQHLRIGDRFRRMNMNVLHPGVTQWEYLVLECIAGCSAKSGAEGVQVSELVRILDILPPALSRILRSLENKRLVVRKNDAKDKRVSRICLTRTGEKLRSESHEKAILFAGKVVDRMGEERMRQLNELKEQLADIVQSELESL